MYKRPVALVTVHDLSHRMAYQVFGTPGPGRQFLSYGPCEYLAETGRRPPRIRMLSYVMLHYLMMVLLFSSLLSCLFCLVHVIVIVVQSSCLFTGLLFFMFPCFVHPESALRHPCPEHLDNSRTKAQYP